MKLKLFIFSFFILIMVLASAFMVKSSTGIQGYAGSPGEGTCSNCHGGGSSASSGITITAVPAFSLNINSELEYMPDSTYQITITTEANGFNKYGFASQILNVNSTNAGTLSTAGAGVKFLNAGLKRTAVHTTGKIGSTATFTFKWNAPNAGDATIYAIANAVNGNNNTSGDYVISPTSLYLVAAPIEVPVDTLIDEVGVKEIQNNPISQVHVFPNPASKMVNMTYYTKSKVQLKIELLSLNGAVLNTLKEETVYPGYYSEFLNLENVAPGVYFIKTIANKIQVAQKLIVVQ